MFLDRRIQTKPVAFIHSIYLNGFIDEPNQYIEIFETIRNARKGETIKIHINSRGGYLSTTVQFLRAMSETQAEVICSVEGDCMSAATMIFLAGDGYEVSKHCSFMIHNYSSGAFGKGNEMAALVEHERKNFNDLANEIYENFLTEQEIEKLLEGKDYWFSMQEVVERCQNRANAEKEKNVLNLEAMSLEELKMVAKASQISIPKEAKSKAAIIEILKRVINDPIIAEEI